MSGPDARRIAAEVVRRVLDEGSYAAAVLSQELSSHPQLSARDRGLATELVYGTLRAHRWLEGRLQQLSPRGVQGLDAETRAHLVVGAYQVCFLDKVPAHAAVDRAVGALREARGPGLAGFANAVLRRAARERDPSLTLGDAVLRGAPRWLVRALDRALGDGQGAAFLLAGPTPPPVGLRVRRGQPLEHAELLRQQAPAAEITLGRVARAALLVRHAGDPRRLAPVESGALLVQEEGSQVVAESLGAAPGERVLDACAGRGNKTLALLDAVGPTGRVDAADLHGPKLERLRDEAARLGLPLGDTFAIDWTRGSGDVVEGGYDRVLVDAPCSGTGTLRRRPEIVLRRTAADLAALGELQRAILARAARAARPGGVVVYATCSVLREELEDVVSKVDGLRVLRVTRLLPHVDGTDGYGIVTAERA